jgi:putative ABC transport system substrate-binding protein
MKGVAMHRREFVGLLGGAAAAWPLAARAQQDGRVRRIGVLTTAAESDPDAQANVAEFRRGLTELGWSDGRNVRIEVRWGAADPDRYRRYSAELIAFAPDVILAVGGSSVGALQQATRTVPIVFVGVVDPVGGGYVASLARPSGNITGFSNPEYGISGKWLELIKQIAPRVTRLAVLRNSNIPAGFGQLGALQSAAASFGVELSPVDLRDAGEIERGVSTFARGSNGNGGLIVTGLASAFIYRDLIFSLAAQLRLPAVYPNRRFVRDGGLISYGPVLGNDHWRAAAYVDRIFKGEKPADLPVQAPTKYETVLNLKTAKALGLQVPDIVLLRADEVIE